MPDLPISGLPAITVPSSSYLLAAVSASVTAQMTVAQVAAAISSSFTSSQAISSSYTSTASYYNEVDPVFVAKSASLATTGSNVFTGNQTITGSLSVSGSTTQIGNNTLIGNTTLTGSILVTGSVSTFTGPKTTISGSFYIASSSVFSENTASSLVSYDTASGQLFHTPYQTALPALFAVGAFYSTGSITTTANQSGSFTYTTSLGINSVTLASGSRIVVDRAATYNLQFSIQVQQGSQAASLAVWLKKNGTNVADTATYVTVPSNDDFLMALNLWDTANSGDYYELAYQSNRNDTSFTTIPATGNIPRSPAIIVTLNQVR